MPITKLLDKNLILSHNLKNFPKKLLLSFKLMMKSPIMPGKKYASYQDNTSTKSIKDWMLTYKNMEKVSITHLFLG